MMALEVFRLFGTIFVNNEEANKSISKTEEKAGGLGEKLLGGIGTAAKWGAGVALAAGTVAVAIGTVAVKAADDYQGALNKLQVTTGASSKKMEELGGVVKNIYANNFGESMSDVANAVSTVTQNLKLSGDELQKVTEYAIGYKDSFGVEVTESTRAAKAMMENFGISAKEAYNLMAQGAQNGLDYSGEMIDNINEYSVQFGKVGLNAEDMFNVFKSGAEAGAFNLDKIGDAVKEFSIRAIDGSKTTAEGFSAIGMNSDEMAKKFAAGGDTAKEAFYQVINGLKNIDDPVAQSAAGVNLFGTTWEDLGPQVVTSLGNVKDGFDKTKGSMDEINKVQYNTFGEAIEGIKRQVETNILIPMGQAILPVLNQFANWFATDGVTYLQAFGNLIQSVMPGIQNAFTTVFGIISPIFTAFTDSFKLSLTDGGSALDNFKNIITTVFGENILNVFQGVVLNLQTLRDNSAPIIEGIKTLFQTWFDYINTIWFSVGKPVFDFLMEQVVKVQEIAREHFPAMAEMFKSMCDMIANLWDGLLKPYFIQMGYFIQNVLLPVFNVVFGLVFVAVDNAFTLIVNLWNNSLKPLFDGIINFLGGLFTGDWDRIWKGIKEILEGIWGAIVTVVKTQTDFINDLVNKAWTWLKDNVITPIWDGIKNKIQEVWNNIKTFITDTVDNIKTKVETVFTSLRDNVITPIWTKIKDKIQEVWTNIKDLVSNAIDSVKTKIETVFTTIRDNIITPIWTSIKDKIQAVWDSIKNTVTNAVDNVKNKIETVFNNVKDNVITPVWTNIKNTITNVWDNIKTIIANAVDNVKNKVETVFTNLKDAVTNIFNNVSSNVSGIWNNIKNTVSNIAGGIFDSVSNKFTSIKDNITNTLNGALSNVSNIFGGIRDNISSTINNARDIVHNAVESIKNKFNFSWSLPSLKLPHFNIEGGFSLDPPSVPSFGIDWYYKGGIFKDPTVLGGIGVGDAYKGQGSNAEAVVPLDEMYNNIRDIIDNSTKRDSKGNIVQNINIYSQTDSPSEIARKFKQAQQELGLAW